MQDYISISELIRMIQNELIDSQKERLKENQPVLFQTSELEIELNTVVTQSAEETCTLGIPIFNGEFNMGDNSQVSQKITLKLKVEDMVPSGPEEAREEARWVCEFLAGYPVTYPVAYNCEGFQSESSRQYGMSAEDRSALAQVFLDEVEAGGYTGMFYAARNELEGNLLWDADTLELKYRIWVARYGDAVWPEAAEPDYSGEYAMWQYTNQGSVPGIDGSVDLNVAYFGYEEAASAQEEGAAEHVEADPEVGVTFEEVNEQVTAKDEVNLRSTMDQGDDSNVVTRLLNGDTATRTGVGNNGWSRLEYNGQTLYAVSSYLTADLSYTPPAEEPQSEFKTQFTTVSENVTAKEVTNLRNRPSVEPPSEVIVQLHNGEVITRTGVSDVGWSRVEYNGQTLYCISSYLLVVE